MGDDAQVSDITGDGSEAPQPQPPETTEVRPGMAADDAEAAEEQGVPGSDPEWGPLGLNDNDSDPVGDDAAEGDDVVQALIAALRSGSAGDASNALALAEAAGHDVSAYGNVQIQDKKDLVALEQDAIAAADDDEDEDEDEEA
jgi:hypothetical protein